MKLVSAHWAGVGVLLLANAVCLPGVERASHADNSLDIWFLEDDPGLTAYHRFQRDFGNDELIIALVSSDSSLIHPGDISRLRKVSEDLEAIDGAQAVLGPVSLMTPKFTGLGFTGRPIFDPDIPVRVSDSVLASLPDLKAQFFTPDNRSTRLLIQQENLADFEQACGPILAEVRTVLKQYFPGESSRIGGIGVVYSALNAYSQRDFALFLGLAWAVILLFMARAYRRWQAAALACAVVVTTFQLTLGIYGYAGMRLNLLTTLIPIVVALLGVLDVMHLLTERNRLMNTGLPVEAASKRALQYAFRPCLFTTLTTMAGFLALMASPMAILKQFGFFSALGIGLCLAVTYFTGYFFLSLVPGSGRKKEGSLGKRSAQLATYAMRHSRKVAFGVVVLLLVSLAGAWRLKNDTYTLGFLPKNSEVARDHDAIEAVWGPYMPFELVVTPGPEAELFSPRLIAAARRFADSVTTPSRVGSVTGFYTLAEAGMRARFGPAFEARMRHANYLDEAVAGAAALYPDLTRMYVAENGSGRITLSGKMSSARELTASMDSVLHIAQATFGASESVSPAGYQPMYARITVYVTRSQTTSLGLALAGVFFLMWVFIQNIKLAALGTLANLMPIAVLFGVMGWLGIYQDLATASVASIALSFCIDDTLHVAWRIRDAGPGKEEAAILPNAFQQVGPAIVLTSAALFLGFAAMWFAELKTVRLFGGLASLTVAAALLSQFTVFPALVRIFMKKNKPPLPL